jgi:hypothetical protein
MKTPQTNALSEERRVAQARKVALLLKQRHRSVSDAYMTGLLRSMANGLSAFGFSEEFVQQETNSLRSLVDQELRGMALVG